MHNEDGHGEDGGAATVDIGDRSGRNEREGVERELKSVERETGGRRVSSVRGRSEKMEKINGNKSNNNKMFTKKKSKEAQGSVW
jgi:hypothetical protein